MCAAVGALRGGIAPSVAAGAVGAVGGKHHSDGVRGRDTRRPRRLAGEGCSEACVGGAVRAVQREGATEHGVRQPMNTMAGI